MTTKVKAMIEPITSIRDLYERALTDERYQRLAIVAANNLGCPSSNDNWKQAFRCIERFAVSMMCEYEQDEFDAEQGIVDEINFVIDCI